MTTLSHATPSRYSLHHTLADLGFEPLRIALAVEVLMGPEPGDGPTDADWDEYADWSKMQDCLEASYPDICEEDIRAAGLAI